MSNNDVVIIGAASTRFGELFDLGFRDLARLACAAALADAEIDLQDVDAAWLGTAFAYTYCDEGNAGTSLAEAVGLWGRPVARVSAYCASGVEAMRQAVNGLRGGECDVALVAGVEKMRDVGPRESLVRQHVNLGHPIVSKGRTAPGMFGLVAERYAEVYADPRPAMTAVAVKNHRYGAANERAHFRACVAPERVESAPPISGRIGLYDACPTTDGAAALVLTRAEHLSPGQRHARIAGIATANLLGYFTVQFDSRFDFLSFAATQAAARKAYADAGITDPVAEIDVAEVHDCFTITELVNYEDLGFCGRGEGHEFALTGQSDAGGALPVNTSGGLKACGHPMGATGVRMVVDVVDHLWRRAGDRQVPDARTALVHSLGGPGSLAAVAVVTA